MKKEWKPPYIGKQTVVKVGTSKSQVNTYGFGKENDCWRCITVLNSDINKELLNQSDCLKKHIRGENNA